MEVDKINKILILASLLALVFPSGPVSAEEFDGGGDFRFYVDISHLPSGNDSTVEFIQIAVPAREIVYAESGRLYKAELGVKISLERDGERLYFRDFRLEDFRNRDGILNPAGFIYYADSVLVSAGEYDISIEVIDLKNRKSTLLGLFFKKYYKASLKANIIAPYIDPQAPFLSEPFFVWSFSGRDEFVPNPMKVYGLENDSLSCFIKARLNDKFIGKRVGVAMKIFSGEGDSLLALDSTSVSVDEREMTFVGGFDLRSYPSGGYLFRASVYGDSGVIHSEAPFSVVWELRNWQRPERDQLLEAKIVFDSDNYEEFIMSGAGKRENMLREFWKEVDPTPGTAVNEKYQNFLERVKYAEKHYGGFVRGAQSDRGDIYIRFGKPDQIIEASVPANRREYVEILAKLSDKYEIVTHDLRGERPEEMVRSGDPYAIRGRPFTSVGMDAGAYELWIYTQMGEPIFKRDMYMTLQSGLRFLFVDKKGTGEYRLVGSSEDAEHLLEES